MNKEKLVDLGEEVLTDIDAALEKKLRRHLEQELCSRLSRIFNKASSFAAQDYDKSASLESRKAHASVKGVLDDCIDRLLVARPSGVFSQEGSN